MVAAFLAFSACGPGPTDGDAATGGGFATGGGKTGGGGGTTGGGGGTTGGGGGTNTALGSCTNRNDGVCIQYLADNANTATSADTKAQCNAENGIFGTTCSRQSNLPTCSATLSVNGGKRVKAIVYWSSAFCARYSSDQVCASYGGTPSGSCRP